MKMQIKILFIITVLSVTVPTLPFFKRSSKEEKFLKAAEKGKISALTKAINAGADVNTRNQMGKTALMLAAINGNQEAVTLLLNNPVIDVNLQDNSGKTALMLAINTDHPAIAELLIKYPRTNLDLQDRNSQDKKKWTALMLAVLKGYPNIVRLLIKRGANPNKETFRGQTALEYAVEYNRPEVVKLLLEGGSNGNITIWNTSIIDYAKENNFVEILKVIKDFVESRQKLLIEEGLPKDLAELTVEFETGLKRK
ncbi:MAG: ankyrin repeat domain-containing protein [Candidatus Babeliales bacterium]